MDKAKKLVLTLIAFASVSGCSSGPAVKEFADTASPVEELRKLAVDMNEAQRNQVDILAPRSFKNALNSMNDAKASQEKGKDYRTTLHDIARGRAFLNRANEVTKLSYQNMEEVVSARQQALDAGAPKYFPKDLQEADMKLRSVTDDLENNELKSLRKNREKLQTAYLDLELKSIKFASLERSRELIDQSLKEGAKKVAPRSLAIAENNYKDVDAYITANRHETNSIKSRSERAETSASHLLKITREAKLDKKTSPEEIALRHEQDEHLVAEKESLLDAKESQLEGAQSLVEGKEKQLQSKDSQLETKKIEMNRELEQAAALAEDKKALETESAFNKKYENAQSAFKNDEAEVYRQGDKLMIRLKGLSFPTASAELKNSNFNLLERVEKVIAGFGKSSIVVEGHTDSLGSSKLNQKLSAQRAGAVKDYLMAHAGAAVDKIEAVGMGDEKPLATNKTSSGRAQNRRVDIVIEPENKSGF